LNKWNKRKEVSEKEAIDQEEEVAVVEEEEIEVAVVVEEEEIELDVEEILEEDQEVQEEEKEEEIEEDQEEQEVPQEVLPLNETSLIEVLSKYNCIIKMIFAIKKFMQFIDIIDICNEILKKLFSYYNTINQYKYIIIF